MVLALIFLKCISDAFQERYDMLAINQYADPEDRDEYAAGNVFWVPTDARRSFLQNSVKLAGIGNLIDAAKAAIARDNPSLKGMLTQGYGRQDLDKRRLRELVDLISTIAMGDAESRSHDLLGQVYEYCLGQSAASTSSSTLRHFKSRDFGALRYIPYSINDNCREGYRN